MNQLIRILNYLRTNSEKDKNKKLIIKVYKKNEIGTRNQSKIK